ncbi:MAG TPA: methyl-accepting chemotaxis protein, partial [Rhodocyclaceae bacterium]
MFGSLRIRTQLLLMTGAVFVLFAVPIAIAIASLRQTQERFVSFIEIDNARLAAFNEMYAQGLQSGQALRNILLDPANRKAYDNLAQAVADFDKALKKARSLPQDRDVAARLGTVEGLARRQAEIRTALLADVGAGRIEEAKLRLNKDETPAWRELKKVLLESIARLDNETQATEAQLAETAAARRGQIVAFSLVSLLALLGVSWLIGHAILRRLGGEPAYATDAMHKLAAGDLAFELRVAAKDSSSLLFAMRTTMERLASTIGNVTRTADSLTSSAQQVSLTSQSLSQASSQQAAAAEQTTAALEEMTASIGDNAGKANTTSGIAGQAAQQAQQGG